MSYQLLIVNGSTSFEPVVLEEISWETQRKGSPSSLKFKVLKTDNLEFQEGNVVRFKKDDTNIFYGYVFSKERDKDNIISVTAYDQLRYFKAKDTYCYTNKTATEVLQMLASDFSLKTGNLDNTSYKIASRIEKDKTLFDIIGNALDITMENTNNIYILFDDFGKLALKNLDSMKLDIMLTDETSDNLSYKSSIDENTYNKIKLTYDNEKTGKREVYISQDSSTIANWGILQYYESIDENTNGKVKSDALLKFYNKKTRTLSINNAFGDASVRAGSLIAVQMDLGDIQLKNYMLVEKAQHTFANDEHFMTLSLSGGDFN